ncbi:splicing regulator RBM11 isoform X9 [Zalophus californianus]|uniref:Splicing regulator RBM11 n=1 Tax=Zalophus californianus TaxID=9704 RepID=A0A6J2CD25_ZALCA|nr:splicing regulator RBM11 isoform X9 [Zalophus californianus]
MFPAQEEADRTVFVGNLEARVREEILYELFLQAGPLTKVTICKDREGKPKTFGFVCFKHPESVSYAIALLNGIRLYGRPINVQYRFGSSRSSEPANQSFESCVKINSHSYRNEEVAARSSFPMQFFPINSAVLPQEYFFLQKMAVAKLRTMSQDFGKQIRPAMWPNCLPQNTCTQEESNQKKCHVQKIRRLPSGPHSSFFPPCPPQNRTETTILCPRSKWEPYERIVQDT